ncbi:MAG TPA: tetratricopeptide repeat protein [Chthonomonadaceae bacterium]|nr:tetratricopeptide repeat protein [Chthonomonadaceae bacterium]
MPERPRGTVTFLFTDVEDSARLWEQHPEAMREALARYDAILQQHMEANNGYVFKTIGDAFFVIFDTPQEGVAAAVGAQCALHDQDWGAIGTLRARMALHTGVAEERDGDYFGPALNRVARLLAVSNGGQILMSQATCELVRDSLPSEVRLYDLHLHRLKDLQQPEHIFLLLHATLPAEFPALRTLDTLPNNLPQQLTSFIGRETEIATVKGMLAASRLLTLTGSGGCGKTRLALQVAADLLEEYPEGVWLVELAAITDPALVPQTVAAAVRAREEPGRPLIETLANFLRPKSVLLLLDNCEHLVAACAQLAEALLRTCPKLRILATSREALGIPGERSWRVPSLALPDALHLPPREALAENEAVRLFAERAVTAQPSFALTERNAAAVAQICVRLDGIPLAIELAAARVKVLSAEQLAQRLDDRFRLLTGGSRTALPRQQTLRATIDWSYDLLSQAERTLLRRLSVFLGGWTLEAAEAVCADASHAPPRAAAMGAGEHAAAPLEAGSRENAGGPVAAEAVLDLLSRLVDKSLVLVEESAEAEARYRLLETVRQYSRDRLMESEEARDLRCRHRDWFLTLAEGAERRLRGPDQVAWLNRLAQEHDNLRMALEWCRAEEDAGAEAGLRLAGALWRFWRVRGYLSEGRERLEAALAQASASERTAQRAKALYGLAALAWGQGDYTSARAYFEECLGIWRALGDKEGIASVLNGLGLLATDQQDYVAARALYEESLALFQELGNKPGLALLLSNLGLVAWHLGDYAEARALTERSLALHRAIGDKGGIALALTNLGVILRDQGDYAASQTYHEESLALFRELGNKQGIAHALMSLGNLAYIREDFATAGPLYDQGLTLFQELGDKPHIAFSLGNRGNIARQNGQYDEAAALYRQALAIWRELGHKQGQSGLLQEIGRLALARGQAEEAAQLFGAAEGLREAMSEKLSPYEIAAEEEAKESLRACLGEEACAAAWAQGRILSAEQSYLYALQKVLAV